MSFRGQVLNHCKIENESFIILQLLPTTGNAGHQQSTCSTESWEVSLQCAYKSLFVDRMWKIRTRPTWCLQIIIFTTQSGVSANVNDIFRRLQHNNRWHPRNLPCCNGRQRGCQRWCFREFWSRYVAGWKYFSLHYMFYLFGSRQQIYVIHQYPTFNQTYIAAPKKEKNNSRREKNAVVDCCRRGRSLRSESVDCFYSAQQELWHLRRFIDRQPALSDSGALLWRVSGAQKKFLFS